MDKKSKDYVAELEKSVEKFYKYYRENETDINTMVIRVNFCLHSIKKTNNAKNLYLLLCLH